MSIAIAFAAVAAAVGAALIVLGVIAHRRRAARATEPDDGEAVAAPGVSHGATVPELHVARSLDVVRPPSQPPAVDRQRPATQPPPVEPLRLLIVEEDVLAGQMIARLLRGHEIVVVASASAGLAMLAGDDRFDAVLCALTMSEMSGVAFANALAERHPALRRRMVFLVGRAATPETERLLALSEVRWVTKPVQYAKLAICISEAIEAAQHAERAERNGRSAPHATSAAG